MKGKQVRPESYIIFLSASISADSPFVSQSSRLIGDADLWLSVPLSESLTLIAMLGYGIRQRSAPQ